MNGPNPERYFDHAATTPLDPRVFEEMRPYFSEHFGNAHSLHGFGRKAAAAVELARERVAEAFELDDPSQVVFTSGATEANNQALSGSDALTMSPFEHSSVFEPGLARGASLLANRGFFLRHSQNQAGLVAVMAVNNETGAILDVAGAKASGARVHSDLTQALGKTDLPREWDTASCSSHKVYGPKGVGALLVRDEPPPSLLLGGEQESGLRAGTLNVPGIVGFGLAALLATHEREARERQAREVRAAFLEGLVGLSDWQTNDHKHQSPFILSVSFRGVLGEALVIECDAAGFAISSGAACSSRSNEPSHVLQALGLSQEWSRGTVRLSFGATNHPESATSLAKSVVKTVGNLRSMRKS